MYNYEEYMKAILGYQPKEQIRNPFTSQSIINNKTNITYDLINSTNSINIPEPTLINIELYPDIFIKINPIIINTCKTFNGKLNQETLAKLVDNIYIKSIQILELENRINMNELKSTSQNNFLRDIIQILILNQLLNNN